MQSDPVHAIVGSEAEVQAVVDLADLSKHNELTPTEHLAALSTAVKKLRVVPETTATVGPSDPPDPGRHG